MVNFGINNDPINVKSKVRYWENSQINNIIHALEKQQLELVNTESIKNKISSNKTIMEYAIQFTK